MTKVYEKDSRDIKNSFKIEVVFEPLMVVVIAVHANKDLNKKVRIPCAGCVPLQGYSYSNHNDTYNCRCVDHLNLGTVPISYRAKMRDSGNWQCKVPLPVTVIRRYLHLDQRRLLRAFQDKFKDQVDVTFEFVQMISAF